jgi:hypothetical protein
MGLDGPGPSQPPGRTLARPIGSIQILRPYYIHEKQGQIGHCCADLQHPTTRHPCKTGRGATGTPERERMRAIARAGEGAHTRASSRPKGDGWRPAHAGRGDWGAWLVANKACW